MHQDLIDKLKKIAMYLRKSSLETILNANNGHIGGNLSSVELLTCLYFGGYFNFDIDDSKNENRDRVLIRGHAGPLRYSIFSLLGYIDNDELKTYRQLGSRLQGHEDMHYIPGVDITPSGSLGMLLSYGVGSSISNKDKRINARTIVFLGDGEEQEGMVSEAARHAASLKLDNLICILDKNGKQLSRPTNHSDGNSDIKQIWNGYGWDVIEILDGNNIEEILSAYKKVQNINKPTMIIANTVKGLGVDGALEHYSGYHTLSAAPDKEIVKNSLYRLKKELMDYKLDFNIVKEMATSLVKKPSEFKYVSLDNSNLYDIRCNQSGINLEEAQDNYMMELKNNIINDNNKNNFYFITPDLLKSDIVESSEFDLFSHFIDTGIREQHAIGMAHGISIENPNARIYICYGDAFAYRALDQINAAASGKSNIMIVGENAGIFQAQNGKTHQSIGQPNALMSIPELDFYEPADSIDLYNVFSHILTKNTGVSYVRFHRGVVNINRNEKDKFNTNSYFINKSYENPDVVIVTSGFLAETSTVVAKNILEKYGLMVNVVNVVNHKSLKNVIHNLIVNESPIFTVYNGHPEVLSSNVANAILLNSNIPRPNFIHSFGLLEGTSGRINDLIKYYGLDEDSLEHEIMKRVKKI